MVCICFTHFLKVKNLFFKEVFPENDSRAVSDQVRVIVARVMRCKVLYVLIFWPQMPFICLLNAEH